MYFASILPTTNIIWLAVILLVIGIVLIVKGGDFFFFFSVWVAEVLKMPKFLIGATIVSIATTESSWTNMWYKYYCELDIPSLPEVVGEYTMGILFNGHYAGEQAFSITAT